MKNNIKIQDLNKVLFLNILRKSEKCIPDLVNTMRDKGNWTHPQRIRVAC